MEPRRQPAVPCPAVVLAWCLFPAAMGSFPLAATDGLAPIDDLISAARHRKALAEIARLQETLPPSERLTAWELDFRGEVRRAVHGRERLYYLLDLSNSREDAPGRPLELEPVSANLHRSDWRFAVVCVDLRAGNVLWSRPVEGLVHLAVDPRTDHLHLYRERLLTLSPESGAVLQRQRLPEDGRGIEGLVLGGTPFVTPSTGRAPPAPDATLLLYDPDLRRARRVAPGDRASVSYGAWPVTVAGTERSRGTVASFDPKMRRFRWSTALGWGTYEPGRHQLRGGGYPPDWTPLAALEEHLLAIDGSGRLTLLEPESGAVVAAPRLAGAYLAMPFTHGRQLIVPSFDWVRSYSMAALIAPEESPDARLRVRKARCLLALGRPGEALQVVDRLLERAPALADAWEERARVSEALGAAEEEGYSRARAVSLAGRVTDETLHDRWGLLRLYDLRAQPSWSLALLDGHVYAATLAGHLWSVRVDDLSLGPIARLDDDTSSVRTFTQLVGTVEEAPDAAFRLPEPPAATPKSPPADWYTEGGEARVSRAVPWRGRQFRSVKGGGVRVLSGGVMRQLPPRLEGVGEWMIHLGPGGPLGYGEGVFELDGDLRPVRRLIHPTIGGADGGWVRVLAVVSTLETIGLVATGAKGAALQVYSRQGRLLAEAPLGLSGPPADGQLIPMDRGYLFADRRLTWVGADATRPTWRFGPPLEHTATDRRGHRWRYFGDPLLAAGCLYVAGLDGQLFVFDTLLVTRRQLPSGEPEAASIMSTWDETRP